MLFLNQIREMNYAALSVLQGKQWERVWHRNIVLLWGLGEEEKEEGGEVRQGRRQTFLGELQRKSSGDGSRLSACATALQFLTCCSGEVVRSSACLKHIWSLALCISLAWTLTSPETHLAGTGSRFLCKHEQVIRQKHSVFIIICFS